MLVFKALEKLKKYVDSKTLKIGLVPTMGGLHKGHLSLVEKACSDNDLVVVSIYINPTQFNDQNDFKNYPFDLETDKTFLSSFSKNVVIYNPDNDEIYPSGIKSNSYNFGSIALHMEGKFRPGHFNGVATVIEKLIKDIKPHNAYFGEKDYQQIQIIKALNKSLELGVKIISCSTEREKDGLAISTRNKFLNPRQRSAAQKIYFALTELKNAKKKFLDMKRFFINTVEHSKDLKVEYFCIASIDDLIPVEKFEKFQKYRIFVAVCAGNIRLIDNEEIKIFN